MSRLTNQERLRRLRLWQRCPFVKHYVCPFHYPARLKPIIRPGETDPAMVCVTKDCKITDVILPGSVALRVDLRGYRKKILRSLQLERVEIALNNKIHHQRWQCDPPLDTALIRRLERQLKATKRELESLAKLRRRLELREPQTWLLQQIAQCVSRALTQSPSISRRSARCAAR